MVIAKDSRQLASAREANRSSFNWLVSVHDDIKRKKKERKQNPFNQNLQILQNLNIYLRIHLPQVSIHYTKMKIRSFW